MKEFLVFWAKKRHFLLHWGILAMPYLSAGQISPPGLGKARTAEWIAVGIRQQLDTLKKKQLVTYFGIGRKSNPNNFNPAFKPAIFVINQEFYHQFHTNWQYSVALSYRHQNEYDDDAPFQPEDPKYRQEFRIYSRFSYIRTNPKIKFTATLRNEYREFLTPHFELWPEPSQYRFRLRVQWAINLNQEKSRRFIISSESLLSTSKEGQQWTAFQYRENRFCLYYSLSSKKMPLTYSIGYMNNLLAGKAVTDVHYLAFDVIWENPFKIKRSKTPNKINLE